MKHFTSFLLSFLVLTAVVFGMPEKIKHPSISRVVNFVETGIWVDQASGFTTASRGINYMKAVDANVCWGAAYNGTSTTTYIVEYTRTTNGGTLWTPGTIAGYATGWGSAMIYATGASKAWMPVFNASSGGGRILATIDGGTTWTHQSTATFASPAGFPNVIHFWNDNEGFTMGDPNGGYFEIYTTTNGGTNWTRVPTGNIPAPAAADEYGVVGYYSVVGNTAWFTTNYGRIFKSTNKGINWSVSTTPMGNNQFKIVMKDELYGIIQNPSTGAAYSTTDGGANWVTLIANGPFYTNDYCYVPGSYNTWVSTGAATGMSGASYSFDGGLTWTDFANTSGTQFLNVDFAGTTSGWAGAFNTSATVGGVRKYIGDLIPVELTSFTAMQNGSNVDLKWTTATEVNNRGFEIERMAGEGSWITVGYKAGFGTTTEAKSYYFSDDISALGASSVSYRLKQIDFDGRNTYSKAVLVDNIAPVSFDLAQNYPNPFNPETKISFSLPSQENVVIKLYDMTGREVSTLVNSKMDAGVHSLTLSAEGLSSGVYLYKMTAGSFSSTKKLSVLK